MNDREAEANYAIGAITGAVKYQKHLENGQRSKQEAQRTAHKWALRQLAISGVDRDEVLDDLKATRKITNRLIETIEMAGMPEEKESKFNDGYKNP